MLAGNVLRDGEVLQYKVKWSFIRLGTVTLRTVRDTSCHSAEDIKLIMIVESNPDLSFIWIREFNECIVDSRTLDSKVFHARHRNGDKYTEIWHVVDLPRHCTYYRVADKNSGAVLARRTPMRAFRREETGDVSGVPRHIFTSDRRGGHGGSAASKLRCFLCRRVSPCRS